MFVASFHFIKWEGSCSVLLILKILFWNSFWYNAAWTRCIWLNLANLGFLLSFYCFLPRMAVAPSKAVGPLFHYLASWLPPPPPPPPPPPAWITPPNLTNQWSGKSLPTWYTKYWQYWSKSFHGHHPLEGRVKWCCLGLFLKYNKPHLKDKGFRV